MVDEGWSDELDRGKWRVYSVVQGWVVEVGVDGRSVVSKVEEGGRCVGHVVVGEKLGSRQRGSCVVERCRGRGEGRGVNNESSHVPTAAV